MYIITGKGQEIVSSRDYFFIIRGRIGRRIVWQISSTCHGNLLHRTVLVCIIHWTLANQLTFRSFSLVIAEFSNKTSRARGDTGQPPPRHEFSAVSRW